jgi:hypothetical protein
MIRIVFALLLIFLSTLTGQADVYRPAYLELQQTIDETYEVVWKVPTLGATRRAGLNVHFLEDVKVIIPARGSLLAGAYIKRSTIRRSGGLAGACHHQGFGTGIH